MDKVHMHSNGTSSDWIRDGIPPNAYCQTFRNYDFTSTTIGPIEQWPPILRQTVYQMMVHPNPKTLIWGPRDCCLFNEAAAPLHSRHGRLKCLGNPIREFWEETIVSGIDAQWKEVRTNRKTITTDNILMLLETVEPTLMTTNPFTDFSDPPHRTSFRCEYYLSLTVSPVLDEHGDAVGIMHEWTDKTRSVLADRRLDTIDEVKKSLSRSSKFKNMWDALFSAFARNPQDIPFAVAYSTVENTAKVQIKDHLKLEKTLGIHEQHQIVDSIRNDNRIAQILTRSWTPESSTQAAPARDLDNERTALDLVRVDSLKTARSRIAQVQTWIEIAPVNEFGEITALYDKSDILELETSFIIPGRGFGVPVRTVLVLPIPSSTSPRPMGVVVVGMNTARPYDREYRRFTSLLKGILVSRLSSIPDSMHLQTLRKQVIEHHHVEVLFKSIAETAPFGIAIWSESAKSCYNPNWWNQAFLEIFSLEDIGIPTLDMEIEKGKLPLHEWHIHIHPDDQYLFEKNWENLQQGTVTGHVQLRVLRKHVRHNQPNAYRWVLLRSSLHVHEGYHSIGAWAIDTTNQKSEEAHHAQRLQDAIEGKRQSEHFIDMVSHELRNPMSAIIQSADSILKNLATWRDQSVSNPYELHSIRKSILEASEVIALCTQHQKRIVDDVLTLSKLDASLLVIAPEEVQVTLLLEKIIQIYYVELRIADIEAELQIDESYNDMKLDRVLLDPSRLLQVLLNLFTNAIKFTRDSHIRKIRLHLGASFTRPEKRADGAGYIPFRNEGVLKNDDTRAAATIRTNSQQTVFLEFSVEDTGRGMSPQELKTLFKKFTQGSPKTYGNYGGSGLGLYITREFVELQGGQIGVTSEENQGSIVFFYIKVDRIDPVRPAGRGARLCRKASFTELLGEFKRRKGAMDRSTTEMRVNRSITPSPKEETKPEFLDSIHRSVSETYDFGAPTPGDVFELSDGPIYVLLVEDNLINQRILAQQLHKEGCLVSTADNGLEAVHFVRQSIFATFPERSPEPLLLLKSDAGDAPPGSTPGTEAKESPKMLTLPKPLSVVLMDIEMPIMNGLEATSRIRDMERDGTVTGRIPIIAITANARAENVEKARHAGMDDVLTKPFRISQLLEKMRDNIEKMGRKTSATTEGMVPL